MKIGFIGNCQIGAMSGLYKRVLPDDADIEVFYLPSYRAADDAQRRKVASADVVVRQVLDFEQKVGPLVTRATEYLFPHVNGAFLWPFTGKPHPLNHAPPYFDQSGPYPIELGDIYLNKMIADKVEPDRAIEDYLKGELPALQRLDRLAEVLLAKQKGRDQLCGYDFASYIESHFRSESLFRSPNHPEFPLTMIMAEALFERMGLDSAAIARARTAPPDSLFPMSRTPIHPSVVKTFGLSFVGKDQRFRYFDEGSFTFEEYCRRYMNFEFNPGLSEGFYWLRNNDPDKALSVLEQCIDASPRSAIGRSVLSALLAKKGRFVEATERARAAVAIEPENPHFKRKLDALLAQSARASADQAPLREDPLLDSSLVIEFGVGGNAGRYLDQGWGATEPGYIWTTSPRASLRFRKGASASGYIMSFAAAPFAPRERPYQRCTVLLNDLPLAEFHVDKPDEHAVWIPADMVTESPDTLLITFELPDAGRPFDFDRNNGDTRQLGLAFKRITLDMLGSIGG